MRLYNGCIRVWSCIFPSWANIDPIPGRRAFVFRKTKAKLMEEPEPCTSLDLFDYRALVCQ